MKSQYELNLEPGTDALVSIDLRRCGFANAKSEIRRIFKDKVLEDYGVDVDVDVNNTEFILTPDCGCKPSRLRLKDIPLEDISCECGKTKLIAFIY